MADAWLTPADPEPPAGTIVETQDGARWWRDETYMGAACNWFTMGQLANPDRHDPESWTKVAGNYGPVKIVFQLYGSSDQGEPASEPASEICSSGFELFDLIPPSKVLMPVFEPLRRGFADRERFERERIAREEQVRQQVQQQLKEAHQNWRELHNRLAGNPIAAAVLDYHQPEAGYERVVCSTCMGDENYEASPETWPCGTFTTVKRAGGG